MLTLNDGRNELWQWDTGRTLTVDSECSQVHFSNKVFGRSIDVDVVDGVASIPDVLLQTDKELTAWAFVGTPENGYTKISKVFKVNKRNKPADYVFTPPEQTALGEILERLDDLEAMQDPDAIKNAVEGYLDNNPIHIKETDPTVPAWAKAAEKPTYTAREVGALPADTKIPAALIVTVTDGKASHTPAEIFSHARTDGAVYLEYNHIRFWLMSYSETECYFVTTAGNNSMFATVGEDGSFDVETTRLATTAQIPTDDHINSLIDTKLGVIENGSY